ncbi:protein archease [Chroococcidiopsis sp. CCALA 051]|uniref:archease n=1 Tax=Chroococcidiopsis sp. CCALA 051 TaxID=869949 RepID=UPI000D0DBEDB|nr:archease [Chroococcidiopsis sp. CCALA 051]PSM46084.1 protein archease [Chroococcidiopsis sp. CCALA 051]
MKHADLLKPKGFEEVEHTADRTYRIWGQSLAELFVQAAKRLYYLVGMQLAAAPQVIREISLQGVDNESLLVAWLNELLYLHESENLGYEQIKILQLDGKTLHAKVTGSHARQWLKDLKAATYHNLAIHSTETGFEATLVLDV